MKIKKYLELLLKNQAVLNGDVTRFVYCRVDFNVEQAVEFANTAALNMLVKFSRLARLVDAYYAQKPTRKKARLLHFFYRGRLEKERQFWKAFGVEVAKIRTRRMLTAMTKDGKMHVRLNNMDFDAEAAKVYYLSLDEEKRLLLMENVGKKVDNTARLLAKNSVKEKISEKVVKNYEKSARFWENVWTFLSNITVVA